MDLQNELGLSYLFISHDMAVVERISHRVAVMYLGQIVEIGAREQVFEGPVHSYTKKLLSAVPVGEFQFGRKRSKKERRATPRLAPVSQVNITSGTKTELNYENTRHRYPWICSLRTRGTSSEHLCAVNLLAVPPNPTVIVGSAHCTYMCKDLDKNGVTLPPCCCVTKGQESCQNDTVKCGIGRWDPGVVQTLLCSRWTR